MKTIVSACSELSDCGMVEFYQTAEKEEYLQIARWAERPRAEKSKYPDCDNTCEQMFPSASKCSPPSSSPSSSSSPSDHRFDEFWSAYPRKEAKAKARDAFSKVTEDVSVLVSALNRLKRTEQWKKDNGKFVPHAATWINGKRWEDSPPPKTPANIVAMPDNRPSTHEEMIAQLKAMPGARPE